MLFTLITIECNDMRPLCSIRFKIYQTRWKSLLFLILAEVRYVVNNLFAHTIFYNISEPPNTNVPSLK